MMMGLMLNLAVVICGLLLNDCFRRDNMEVMRGLIIERRYNSVEAVEHVCV